MEKIILIVHSMSALIIIGLILLQQGKGAATGASFGSGASQTVFGSDGGGSFFTRATAIFATIFFVASITLAVIAKNHSKIAAQGIALPTSSQQVPAAPVTEVPISSSNTDAPTTVPAAQAPAAPSASDVPVMPASPSK